MNDDDSILIAIAVIVVLVTALVLISAFIVESETVTGCNISDENENVVATSPTSPIIVPISSGGGTNFAVI